LAAAEPVVDAQVMTEPVQKIFGEMRDMGMRGILTQTGSAKRRVLQ
jgi:hypothetical protein